MPNYFTRFAILLFVTVASAVLQLEFNAEDQFSFASSPDAKFIPDSYLITLKSGVLVYDHVAWFRDLHDNSISMNDMKTTSKKGCLGGVRHVYDIGEFQGLSGRFSQDAIEKIRKNPLVSHKIFP